jgi:hypothetical protein
MKQENKWQILRVFIVDRNKIWQLKLERLLNKFRELWLIIKNIMMHIEMLKLLSLNKEQNGLIKNRNYYLILTTHKKIKQILNLWKNIYKI